MEGTPIGKGLPANAYSELKPGEKYVPIVGAGVGMPEVTLRSVFWGILMSVIFAAAAAFLGLKVGQVFEAAIPIAVLAVGIGLVYKRKSTLLENVIIQSIGAASGLTVAGAIFTLPALFILGVDHLVNYTQIFLASLFGGVLGVLFLIPFRRYFVAEMHGKFPFPEATATTEVLVAGQAGGKQAVILAVAMVIGGAYDFLSMSMRAWAETFTTATIPFFAPLTNKVKAIFSVNTGAAVLGLGLIIGLKYSLIIACGSFMTWFVIIPVINHLGSFSAVVIPPVLEGGKLIAQMDAWEIFRNYARYIGIGAIFAAGVIGIIRTLPVMWKAISVGIKELMNRKGVETSVRTDRDIKMSGVFVGVLLLAVVVFLFFRFMVMPGQANPTTFSIIALLVAFIISFLFTTVAARAIAIVGTNPVSGMTLMTLILASAILVGCGLTGEGGMLAVMLIGGVVCTALSMAGGVITDLKVGYWIGSTPARQQWSKMFGTFFAAAAVAFVVIMLNKVYGFVPSAEHPNPLPAPQANAMAAVIKTMMGAGVVPWMLYAVGALIAVIMHFLGIPALPFALGMYIPLDLNMPILLGGIVSHFITKSTTDEKLGNARRERLNLVASGFIAGGAILGVVGTVFKYLETEKNIHIVHDFANDGLGGNYLGLVALMVICLFAYLNARRAKAE